MLYKARPPGFKGSPPVLEVGRGQEMVLSGRNYIFTTEHTAAFTMED